MQFRNPFKKEQPAPAAPERIEPQIGDEAPAPWEVKPEAPAFDVVSDERDPADVRRQPPRIDAPAGGRESNGLTLEEAGFEPLEDSPVPIVKAPAADKAAPPAPDASAEAEDVRPPAFAPVSASEPAPAPRLSHPKLDARGMAPEPTAPAPKPVPKAEAEAVEKPADVKPARGFFRFGAKAEQPSDEDDGPTEAEILARQKTTYRLVGAAAIMMAVIVAAPVILDSEKDLEKAAVSTEIPPVPSQSTTTLEPVRDTASSGDVDVTKSTVQKTDSTAKANLANEVKQTKKPDAQPAAPVKKAEPAPLKTEKKASEEKKAAEQKAAEQKAAEKKPAPAAKSAGVTPPTGKGFFVQVMATSSERKADTLIKQFASQGLPAYKLPVKKQGATIWSVRVGLYKTRDEARGAQGAIALGGFTSKTEIGAQ